MTENIITLTSDDRTAAALVATIKAAVNGDGKYAAYVADHAVTKENVADHARALAVLTYPNDEPVQKKDGKRTRFGNAVQKAGAGLRRALEKDENDDDTVTDYLARVVKAAQTAHDHEISTDQIIAAVQSALAE